MRRRGSKGRVKPARSPLSSRAKSQSYENTGDKQPDNPLQQPVWRPGHSTTHSDAQGSAGLSTPNIPVSQSLQAKLTIGAPNDQYEQEADRVAEHVMRMPENSTVASPQSSGGNVIQRTCASCAKRYDTAAKVGQDNLCPECQIQTKSVAGQISRVQRQEDITKEEDEEKNETLQTKPLLQRQAEEESEEEEEEDKALQADSAPGQTPNVTPAIGSEISAMQGGGQPLHPVTRAFMEPRFGHDFSQVRVHADTNAVKTSQLINARAFTSGHNIAFGAGQYQPETAQGKRLLAHELTHVVQQGVAGIQMPQVQRQVYGESATGVSDPNAIISVSDFIGYVRDVESAYPGDTPTDIVSRIRVAYYSGLAFEQLIPGAHTHDIVQTYSSTGPVVVPRILSERRLGEDAYSHLTARADENAIGDNPSPYILLPGGKQVDLGHLLLGLDALLHPGAGEPYSTFSVPGIDPASWVADIGIAAVWMTQHEEDGEAPDDAPRAPSSPNLDTYYDVSAPEHDLLGDVDSFGVHEQWNQMAGQPLSAILEAYYIGTSSTARGADRRWQTFCAGNGLTYTRSGNTITWGRGVIPAVQTRVNNFNDLYAAGGAGAAMAVVVGPTRRSWPHTPAVVDKFLDWVKVHLEAELARSPATGGTPSSG